MVNPDANSSLHVASNLADSPDRATVRAEIRVPPVTPKPPPPARAPSDDENAQTTDVPSDYQSDWYGDWNYSNWMRNRNRHRSSQKESFAFFFGCASLRTMVRVGIYVWYWTLHSWGSFGSPLWERRL